MQVPCPICRKPVEWRRDNPYRPFCSRRCKLIDLGEWATEKRYIPGPPAEDGQPSPPEDFEP
ncbi:conserved hypothetical protein [Methylomarinovum caldicuralii]|uniref:DNA gyrase inhibitor YacG n=1 Tax=Methylomarinovum caldicuralii TaxID=438856 RepID=A0AAU9BQP5_9GAMM|nr:DNA gyrase inhibitor YacG [Methylomarinovum caldicuralii]BCX81063.1 conserved hypothetical protein [Methylomarinovum caldicuralii]